MTQRDPLDDFDEEEFFPEEDDNNTASTFASTLSGDLTLSSDENSGLTRDEEIVLARLVQSKPGGLASLNRKTKGLHKLCQSNALFFGEANTPRRRKFQNKVDRWKKLSRAEWIVELDDLGVPLNPTPAPASFCKQKAPAKKAAKVTAVPTTVSAKKLPPIPTRPLAFSPITKMSTKNKKNNFVEVPNDAKPFTIDLDTPEKLGPVMIFPFMQAPINDGKEVADGFDIEIWDGHVMDVLNDRYKLQLAGPGRKQLLLEMALVSHKYLAHFNSYAAKLQSGDFSEPIFKQHILARNELLADSDRHQQFLILSVPDGGVLSCDHFPYDRETTGDEVDYDVVPYITDDKNGKKVYRNTNATISWKVIFEDTVRAAKRSKAAGKRGKSKLDGIDEGANYTEVQDSSSSEEEEDAEDNGGKDDEESKGGESFNSKDMQDEEDDVDDFIEAQKSRITGSYLASLRGFKQLGFMGGGRGGRKLARKKTTAKPKLKLKKPPRNTPPPSPFTAAASSPFAAAASSPFASAASNNVGIMDVDPKNNKRGRGEEKDDYSAAAGITPIHLPEWLEDDPDDELELKEDDRKPAAKK